MPLKMEGYVNELDRVMMSGIQNAILMFTSYFKPVPLVSSVEMESFACPQLSVGRPPAYLLPLMCRFCLYPKCFVPELLPVSSNLFFWWCFFQEPWISERLFLRYNVTSGSPSDACKNIQSG